MSRVVAISMMCLLAAMAMSCAKPMAVLDMTVSEGIVWPGGEEKPRIKYLWSMYKVTGAERGAVSKLVFGEEPVSPDPRDSDYLVEPHGVFVDNKGRLYIADTVTRRVNIIDLKTMDSFELNKGGDVKMGFPVSVASGPDGTIYVSDADFQRVGIYSPDGKLKGFIEGELNRPTGLAVDAERGVLYVTDTWEHIIYKYNLEGQRLGAIGSRGTEAGQLNYPVHLAVGPDGTLYVADSMNFRVQMFSPDGEFVSEFGAVGSAYGEIDKIKGIAVDSEGHIYITDAMQDMVKIFDRTGRLLLFFGKRGSYYGDFAQPAGIYINDDNTIYVADALNRRVQAFQFLGGQ